MTSRKVRAFDAVAAVAVRPSLWLLRRVRGVGIAKLPRVRRAFRAAGVYPLVDHYYEPLFRADGLGPTGAPRALPGIDLDDAGQLELLRSLDHADEFEAFLASGAGFSIDNTMFGSGDADFLYAIVRHLKPARIVEVGSGHSTAVAAAAVARNAADDPRRTCAHTCIEPYENPWLESLPVDVVRRRVEDCPPEVFDALGAGDLLFIDSSHVIRPGGDVLHELLEVLPRLAPGVVVHLHDVFTPRDYPRDWLDRHVRLWNEQYLLEAFLTGNREWRVLAALNHLAHEHPAELARVCPTLTPGREPGSFYLVRR